MNSIDLTALESAVIPITGAASGIGLAICKRLRSVGARPLLLDVSADQLRRALPEVYPDTDASGFGYQVDVRDAKAVDACFEQLRNTHGLAKYAVACAAIVHRGHILDMPDAAWRDVIDVNLNGALYTCRAAARHMAEARGGAIVSIASIAGLLTKEKRVAYSASKGAVIQMTRALAIDLGSFGIRVNCVAPGVIDTPMQKNNATSAVSALVQRSALKRVGTPEEIANVVLFLLSDCASYITGHTIVADGGLAINYGL